MTVLKSAPGVLLLEGACPSDEAEILLQHLASDATATVDVRNCWLIHTAVVQVLLAAKPTLLGPPAADTPLWRWVYPALSSDK
jgi:hypothetical protein